MAKLSVNIDHVATLREVRKTVEPDPIAAAVLAELAGAEGIIVHLREDRRHIQDRDLHLLRKIVRTRLNLEMAPTEEMVSIALEVKPDMVTLVPEKREELTTEGGLDVVLNKNSLQKYIKLLQDGGILVSLFIDPDLDQVKVVHKIGGDYIEIHTGKYAEAKNFEAQGKEFANILDTVKMASKLRLGVNAGHGLTYLNAENIAKIKEIEELNIGHSIISRAVLVGLDRAVREMIALVR